MQALDEAIFLKAGEIIREDWTEWVICRWTALHMHQGSVLDR